MRLAGFPLLLIVGHHQIKSRFWELLDIGLMKTGNLQILSSILLNSKDRTLVKTLLLHL